MKKTRVLTGITPSGTPHLGNYVGAIRPAIEASLADDTECFYFLADLHALIKAQDPALMRQSRLEVAATWLALGLDPDRVIFYRQSDVIQITQLCWFLMCVCAKGLMNRAHAYKAAVAENEATENSDADRGITMGLYSYPVLMAADILMFNIDRVPVGRDQIQHLEMARDIAARFNYIYRGDYFTLPEVQITEKNQTLVGLDGRKMSKSYRNTIPLFCDEAQLHKLIRKIKTNSVPPGVAKDTTDCALFQLYAAFASTNETEQMRKLYAEGIGWGEVKELLFELINSQLSEPRLRYQALLMQPDYIDTVLQQGAHKAQAIAEPLMAKLRYTIGL